MFPIVGFLAHQILGIVRFQIEKKRIFFLVNILRNLSYYLQMTNLKKFIFVNKNWLHDSKADCKSFSNLVQLIEKDLEKKS
jgi:hypothetical protein